MKKPLHFICLMGLLGTSLFANAQSLKLERYILVTDTITDEGATFEASSDDAEQENDAMDALFDDDLDAGWEGAPEDQNILTTGLRFRNIHIPQGATIDSAHVILHAHEGKTADDVSEILIWGEASDNAQTYDENSLITDRPSTSATTQWVVDEDWSIWQPYKTVDISSIIQEIVNRGGWQEGNALAVVLQGQNQGPSDFENAREFMSFENIKDPEDTDGNVNGDGQNHPENRPQLVVYYSVENVMTSNKILVTDTITDEGATFEASSDDAEQENDAIDALFDDDLDAGWEGAPEDQNILTTGLRFRNLPIPADASIDSAFVKLWAHEGKTADDVAELLMWAEATDSAVTFDENNLITDRTPTTNQLTWVVDEDWDIWQGYSSPNIGAMIQEVVDRPGWKYGNAIAIILQGQNQGPSDFENAREFMSFENIKDPEDTDGNVNGDGQNHPENRPELIIYYSSRSSVGVVSVPAIRTFKVYPNPATDQAQLVLPVDESGNVMVYNLQGQLVNSLTNVSGNVVLNTSDLETGLYIIQANFNGTQYTSRLVIQK